MRTRWLLTTSLLLGALLPPAVTPASAKDFGPGDVRLCTGNWCAPIVDQGVLNALSRFYYGSPAPAAVHAPRLRAPYFQLRFGNDYVTGIAGGARLDRFRSYGVNDSQFRPDRWYRVPPKAALGLRKLAAGLAPLRVTASTIAPRQYA